MGPDEIKKLHQALNWAFSKVLEKQVWVRQVPDKGKWERAVAGTNIEFELLPKNMAESEQVLRDRGGRKASSLPLCTGSQSDQFTHDQYWVSWYERWQKAGKNKFKFHTGSWTVFKGITSVLGKTQLLRADWDQLCNMAGSKDSGQPHWHLDQPVSSGGNRRAKRAHLGGMIGA